MITPAALRTAYAAGDSIRLPTSGTSARPRQVIRTAASWVESFGLVADLCGLDAASRVWVPGPVAASMNAYAVCLVDQLGALLVDDAATASHVFCTPAALADLLDHDRDRRRLTVVVAGDRLSPGLADRAEAAGHVVHHYYGAAQLSFVGWGRDADTLRPFPQVSVQALDGVLWVSSPWLCLSEQGQSEQGQSEQGQSEQGQSEQGTYSMLRSVVRDGRLWMSVGDRGSVSPDGRLLITGRSDTVVTAGATVLLADVEATLRPYARGEVVVVGRWHPRLGAVLVAVCTDPADASLLPGVARRELPASHRPRAWSVVAELPVTAAGKLDRSRLADR